MVQASFGFYLRVCLALTLIHVKTCPSSYLKSVILFSAVLFLEYWKRKEVTMGFHWDVLEFESEEVSCLRTLSLHAFETFPFLTSNVGDPAAIVTALAGCNHTNDDDFKC